jgi:acyl-CoA dehydrogenase
MTTEPSADADLVSTVGEFFADKVAPDLRAEFDLSGLLPAQLWEQTDALGLTRVGISEDLGGSGGSLYDALAIMMSMGRNAVPLPLAETYLAAWALAAVGVKPPPGPMTVVPVPAEEPLRLSDGKLVGIVHDVTWAPAVSCAVTMVDDPAGVPHVVAFDPSACITRAGRDLAGQPQATMEISQPALVSRPAPFERDSFARHGALVRAAQMSGAMVAVDRLTRRYVSERVQFGQPIGRFQSVQQHVVAVAQAAEISTVSVWRAARAYADRRAHFEICAAKLLANENARISVRAAHQAHGAIGMTREYPLHLYTRRLNLWRQEFGTEQGLAVCLGTAVSEAPSFARIISDHDNELAVPWPTI